MRPRRRQLTRLPHPWDSPGKNTGVGCHFPLQCMKVKSESEAAQSCPTLSDPMDCSLPGSSAHGIFQARVLQWGAIAFSVSLLKEMLLKTYVRNFCRSLAKLCPLCNLRDFSTPGFPVLHCLTEFAQLMSIESVMSSNHSILCHPLLLLPSI